MSEPKTIVCNNVRIVYNDNLQEWQIEKTNGTIHENT